MMLYLTGASASRQNTPESAQTDPTKSLGGYISSSLVPNASVNSLFDLISIKTIKDCLKETIAIGLVNEFPHDVKDITLKVIGNSNDLCKFNVAAVALDERLCMESINNRYAEPVNAEFHDVTFLRASVDIKIVRPAIKGEEIVFDPFDITVNVKESGIEGTYQAIKESFESAGEYKVVRLNDNAIRVERVDDEAVNEEECSFLTTDDAVFEFLGNFKNEVNNEVYLTDSLKSGEGVGIWLQRELIPERCEKSDEELVKDCDENKKQDTLENVELVISYNLLEEQQDGRI